MSLYSRRSFIAKSAGATAAIPLMAAWPVAAAKPGSPNADIHIGIAGIGWKGGDHVKELMRIEGVRITALCDPDLDNLASGMETLRKEGLSAKQYRDIRDMLDDPDIDAVSIATPNHWHALATVWACQAGKDVYVEKPVTHNLWEGRKMVEAARKYNRIVQGGTQNRSDVGFIAAMNYIREGHLGKILWTHGFWFKYRENGDAVAGPHPVPASLDYNLWTGPAPLKPLMRKNLHYDWHWDWDTGNGDFGNLGGHKADDSLNIIQTNTLPDRILCLGGLYGHTDGWQTPNMQAAFVEYSGKPPVIVDVRSLPAKAGAKYEADLRKARKASIIQCENGYFTGGRGGGIIYDNGGNRLEQFPGDGGRNHFQNWIDAIRSRNRESLVAEIGVSVNSASLCHLANIAYRSGTPTTVKAALEYVSHDEHAVETVESIAAQVRDNGFDLEKYPLTCSGWMKYDADKMVFSGSSDYTDSIANALAKPSYRAPFVVPDKV